MGIHVMTPLYELVVKPVVRTLYPNGDGDLTQLLSSGQPHWQMVLEEDTIFIRPNGGGPWGYWIGNYVYKGWYPWGERADLYTFTSPIRALAQPTSNLTIHCLVGRDHYPWGKVRIILKTHGQLYYSGYWWPTASSQWIQRSWTTNPYTNTNWTKEEVKSLQAGISMDKVGSYGALMCDKIYIELV